MLITHNYIKLAKYDVIVLLTVLHASSTNCANIR